MKNVAIDENTDDLVITNKRHPDPYLCTLNEYNNPKQPKARWIKAEYITGDDSNTYQCTACGRIQQLMDGNPAENGWYYCPHCGAKMEMQ